MGYSVTTSLDQPSARSLASPKTHVPGSRLSDAGHRYYSATLSRWISRDPIGELVFIAQYAAQLPMYLFVRNCPQSEVDPLGLVEFEGCTDDQKQRILGVNNRVH